MPDPVMPWPDPMPNGVTDEFVEPVVCDKDGTISDNDSVIFFNYRPDRAREITRALVDPDFDGFPPAVFSHSPMCATRNMTPPCPMCGGLPRVPLSNGLGEYLSSWA